MVESEDDADQSTPQPSHVDSDSLMITFRGIGEHVDDESNDLGQDNEVEEEEEGDNTMQEEDNDQLILADEGALFSFFFQKTVFS